MNFELNEEQRIFFDSVNNFAHRELADGALSRSRDEKFPFDIAERFVEMHLLGLTIPEADGGQGGTLMDAILAILAIADACPRSADVIQAGNFGAIRTFAEYGTPEQKQRFLPDLLAGKAVMAVAMTEPDAGSAVTELATTAVEDAKCCIINGSKLFGTHSSDADVFLVYVRYGPGLEGIGSVLVERDTPGFTIGTPSRFMNGEIWSELVFDDCRIPQENILLGPGGFKKQLAGFNVERLGNAARALAVGQHAFNVARDHALTRQQFGRPLCEFQGLQWKFAEMKL
ncbi:MAG: acyl-CoA dehydrogenase family protein, partial [Methyloligellaceae bacterium]